MLIRRHKHIRDQLQSRYIRPQRLQRIGLGEFVMDIRDNGDAFDPESVTSRGRGIANIKTRASMIGADIGWERPDEHGNRFVLKISK
jgi:signal transduction histidine kinase